MNRLLNRTLLSATCLLATNLHAGTMTMGDGQVDVSSLKPYEFTWIQCAVQEETWINMPQLTESMSFPDDQSVLLQQSSTRPDGGQSKVKMLFDSPAFAPRKLDARHANGNGDVLAASEFEFTEEGYSGSRTQGGQTNEVNGHVNATQFAGTTMGLPLASLGWQDEPLEFSASMVSFDGTYDVIATWTERITLETANGASYEVFHVDVHWHHRETGDVYPPGPDATGGRYWLVPDPPEGIPYVLRYKTDAYAVEFEREYCPQ